MNDNNVIGITIDGVCDLPVGMLYEYNIEPIQFIVVTENGCFRDKEEMTGENVFEHMGNGGYKAEAEPPSIEDYAAFFEKMMKKYKKIVHISTSSKLCRAYDHAVTAAKRLNQYDKRINIVDSLNVSSGMGLMAIKAAMFIRNNASVKDIIFEMDILKNRISTTFMLHDALYMYLNDLVQLKTVKICSFLRLHPVLIVKDGRIKFHRIYAGSYYSSARRYAKSVLKGADRIDKKYIFITHANANINIINGVKAEVSMVPGVEHCIATKASATAASYFGPNTFGVLYLRK